HGTNRATGREAEHSTLFPRDAGAREGPHNERATVPRSAAPPEPERTAPARRRRLPPPEAKMFRRETMRRIANWTRGCGMLVLLVAVFGCGGGNVPLPDLSGALMDTAGLVERGEYLVRNAAVCGHCHAEDPQRDPDGPLSGGMTFRNWRLGAIRAANLTPDSATGLGRRGAEEIMSRTRPRAKRE